MSTILRLSELFARSDEALAATGILLTKKPFRLDATNVETLNTTQLDALLGALPLEWGITNLAEVIDTSTLHTIVHTQLTTWLHRRLGAAAPDDLPDERSVPETVRIASGAIHPIRALDRVIEEYRDYLRDEFHARDPGLKEALAQELATSGFLAQETFFQAHRPFKPGKRWRDLSLDGHLAGVMERRAVLHAYLHQSEVIEYLLGPNADPIVVTTGTGSGKTETFFLPAIQNAIDDAIRYKHPGLAAILVYSMNALANDQIERITVYLSDSGFSGTVDVRQYDRGTSQKERHELRRHPPHILLTNYMMLEYLLVRPVDRDNIFANQRCRFLVLDEVYTYRGTLGSSIALLVRRLTAHLGRAQQDWHQTVPPAERKHRFPDLIPISTSATIKSLAEGNLAPNEQFKLRDQAVQGFFRTLTGATPESIRVIGETLEKIHPPVEAYYSAHPGIVNAAQLEVSDASAVHQAFCALSDLPAQTPLVEATQHSRLIWDLNRLLFTTPLSPSQIVEHIGATVPERTTFAEKDVAAEVKAALTFGAALPDNTPGVLRLRAHRLIRGGWQFHRCLNPACGKLYPMGERQCHACGFRTAPLYLCRSCAADYLRFSGEDPKDPTVGVLTPSATPNEPAEWLLYEPQRFDLAADDAELDENDDAPENLGRRGTPKATSQMRGRPVEPDLFDPQTCLLSRDKQAYPLPATLAPARTHITPQGLPKQKAVDALITGVRAQTAHALELDQSAWGIDVLHVAELTTDEPRCSPCLADAPGRTIPAVTYAGFVAIRDNGPILDEEERFAVRNRVTGQTRFEPHGFYPQKQVPVALNATSAPISVADFALPDRRLAIYIDDAAFHVGINMRRDRAIRTRLRNGAPLWQVIELRAHDLRRGADMVQEMLDLSKE